MKTKQNFPCGTRVILIDGASPIEQKKTDGTLRVFIVHSFKLIKTKSIPSYFRIAATCDDGSHVEASEHLFRLAE